MRPHEGQRLLPPAGQALDRPVPDDRRRETPPEHRGGLYAKVQPRLRLLAETDERHDTPSGPAVKKLCEGAWRLFGQSEYERLAQITVSLLYITSANPSRARLSGVTSQRPDRGRSPIGGNAANRPQRAPRIYPHRYRPPGDSGGKKGVYHVSAVGEVTQFEVVCTVEKISESYLIPMREHLLDTLAFTRRGFHSDNHSEYINKRLAELLEKPFIAFTKSRSRQSNDNALAESKNGSVVRKVFGYSHIPSRFAQRIHRLNQEVLNFYANYHHPCFFPRPTRMPKAVAVSTPL